MSDRRPRTILAVASRGGHWVQLLRMRPAFEGCRVVYATSGREQQCDVPGERLYAVGDASTWNKLGLVILALRVALVVLWVRPDVVISTGAAPGYAAVRVARLLRKRTIWIDSIANADQMSLSGRRLQGHADVWLTQWPHIAVPGGPTYAGRVL
jgi:hypothetical protein